MKRIAILIFIAFFVYSAMELITVRYQQRLLYIDLVRVQNEAKKLDQVWSFLQLDRANLTSTLHIDAVMTEKLKMQTANIDQIIYIKDSELTKQADVETDKEP